MATRIPIYASIPYASLTATKESATPALPRAAVKTVDELLDELEDDESDSGFAEEDAHRKTQQQQEEDGDDDDAQHPEHAGRGTGTALLDAPTLFPRIDNAANDEAQRPWTRWTSSRITSLDTAYGTTEDKLDCIWLVAGCEDGSIWIFCSLSLSTSSTTPAGGASGAASLANAHAHSPRAGPQAAFATGAGGARRNSSFPNLLLAQQQQHSPQGRPIHARARNSSDTILRSSTGKRSHPAQGASPVPSSPGSFAAGKAASSSSMVGSRSGSSHFHPSHYGHGGTRKNRSISLAMQGSPPNYPSSGAHTPRKASATISVSDFDAFKSLQTSAATATAPSQASMPTLAESVKSDPREKDLPSPPMSPLAASLGSPSLNERGRPSFSFEELPQPEPPEFDKIKFQPHEHVTLNARHSPIVDVKLLPPEGNTAAFLCLTQNGRLFKLACDDGSLLGKVDLGCTVESLSSNFESMVLQSDRKEPLVLCVTATGDAVVPVRTANLQVLPYIKQAHGSRQTLLQTQGQSFLLETREDGHLFVGQVPQKWMASDDDSTAPAGPPTTDMHDAGHVGGHATPLLGVRTMDEDIIAWTESEVKILRLVDQKARITRTLPSTSPLQDVLLLSSRKLALVSKSLVRFASLDSDPDEAFASILDFSLSERIESASCLLPLTSSADCVVLVTRDQDGCRRICLAPMIGAKNLDEDGEPDVLIAYSTSSAMPQGVGAVSAALTLDDGVLICGTSTGQVTFANMRTPESEVAHIAPVTASAVTVLNQGPYRNANAVFVGYADGTVTIYDALSRSNFASSHLFASPVMSIANTAAGMMAIAADGSIALWPLADTEEAATRSPDTEIDVLFIPGSRSALSRVLLRRSQLLVVYDSGLARLWDVENAKLQKTLDHSGAADILAHMDGWTEIELEGDCTRQALPIDLRQVVVNAAASCAKGSRRAEDNLDPTIRWLLSHYLVPVHEAYVQTALREHLRVEALSGEPSGFSGSTSESNAIFAGQQPFSASHRCTAQRLLVIVALCRVFLNFADTERYANEVIAYFATQLNESAGTEFKDASLDYLADFWLDESAELRQAARMLFGARVGRLTDDEVVQEVQERQGRMLQSHSNMAKELLVLGEIAIAKQSLLSSGILRTIAYQMDRSLDETDSPASQNVSLELCIRGFAVFQNSFDAVRVLRSIFHLATSTSTLPTLVNLRNLARQAVLSIAAINAPLFMTVLSFDAVQADADSEERAKTMKLIAFMVRKKPIVLFASIPRLVEMVVRSLDPRGGLRGALQQTATFILSELVKTYPSIAFHGKTQRLAVGTHEGAVVVYDLKTATRLYILDSHKKRASAVSYSPDGRRLVTVSLEESTVKVWKVGTSLLGLLNPTGPPPQGHGAQSHEAYKTLDYKLASPEEAMMTAAAQLEWLTVDWLEERRVKIKIRETALTFSVV